MNPEKAMKMLQELEPSGARLGDLGVFRIEMKRFGRDLRAPSRA